MGGGCTLPYPERFHRAVDFVEAQPAGARDIKDDTLLLLYALNQQATAGPCNEPKPWGWNVSGSGAPEGQSPHEPLKLQGRVRHPPSLPSRTVGAPLRPPPSPSVRQLCELLIYGRSPLSR